MSDFGTMVSRIADELGDRTDLNTQIQREILSAINHYQRESFFFTEARDLTFSTVAGQEFYGSADEDDIPNLPSLDAITLTSGTRRKALERRTYADMEEFAAQTDATGEPEYFAYHGREIRLHPIPDAAYSLRVSSDPRLATLSADTDTNAWMTEAEEMIRCRAKRGIAINILRDPELRDEMARCCAEAHAALRAETRRRGSTGRLRVDHALSARGAFDINRGY